MVSCSPRAFSVSNTCLTMSSTDISVRSCWVLALVTSDTEAVLVRTIGGLSDRSASKTAGFWFHAGTGAEAYFGAGW